MADEMAIELAIKSKEDNDIPQRVVDELSDRVDLA